MDPITMIVLGALGGFLGGAAAAGAVHVAVLTLPTVLAWFRARRAVSFVDRDLVAATMVDLVASGSYRTVQGVFNTRTNHWAEYRTVESYRLDWGLARLHRTDRFVIHDL